MGPKSLYLATPLAFALQWRGSPGKISVKFPWMSMDDQGTKWRRNIAKNFNWLSRVHEHYRQTTDRQMDGRQHIANVNVNVNVVHFGFKKTLNTLYDLRLWNGRDLLTTLGPVRGSELVTGTSTMWKVNNICYIFTTLRQGFFYTPLRGG